jgi:hypothetical protein
VNGVELVFEMALGKQGSKFAVGRQQAFLLAAGQEEIGRGFGICRAGEDKRIAVTSSLAS